MEISSDQKEQGTSLYENKIEHTLHKVILLSGPLRTESLMLSKML